jgi:hypothetical protein
VEWAVPRDNSSHARHSSSLSLLACPSVNLSHRNNNNSNSNSRNNDHSSNNHHSNRQHPSQVSLIIFFILFFFSIVPKYRHWRRQT